MNFNMLTFALILILAMFWQTGADKKCYEAKICFHNGNEKCGVDKEGVPRRFLDTCDMLEYNCLNKTDFVVASASKCEKLPPIVINLQPDVEKKQKNYDINT